MMRGLPYIFCLGLILILSLSPFNKLAEQPKQVGPAAAVDTQAAVDILLPSPVQAPLAPLSVPVRYVSDEILNVFSGPGYQFELINKLSIGDQVIALRDSAMWTEVAFTQPTDTGYVMTAKLTSTPVAPLEVTDWIWRKDPGVGQNGAIVYEGSVENNTDQYKHFVKLKLITYDAEKKFVGADDVYISGRIPPFGQGRFSGSVAARGNEHDAVIKVSVNN